MVVVKILIFIFPDEHGVQNAGQTVRR